MCGNYSSTNAVTQSPRKGIKQKIEHGIPCYIEDSKKAVDLHRSKPLTYFTDPGWVENEDLRPQFQKRRPP